MTGLDLLDCLDVPALAIGRADGCVRFWNMAIEDATTIPRRDALRRTLRQLFGSMVEEKQAQGGSSLAVEGLGSLNFSHFPQADALIGALAPDLGISVSEKDHEREVYLGMAAHDLRAPLRNIGYLCEEVLLEAGLNSEASVEHVKVMAGISEGAISLLDEVVSSAQASSAARARPTMIDLPGLCDTIFAMLDPLGRHLLGCVQAQVFAEKPLLQIVLRNLIDNAIRHGGSDQLSLEISVGTGEAGFFTLIVSDNGKGFADPALAYLAGGDLRYDSGFGLVGIRRLIAGRNGKLNVAHPKNGPGSVITITLPGRILAELKPVAQAS